MIKFISPGLKSGFPTIFFLEICDYQDYHAVALSKFLNRKKQNLRNAISSQVFTKPCKLVYFFVIIIIIIFYLFFFQTTFEVLTTLYRFIVQTDALGGAGKSKVCKNCLDNLSS